MTAGARARRVARYAVAAGWMLVATACARGNAGSVTGPVPYQATPAEQAFLDTLSRRTFDWFWETTNPANGLVPDRWPTKSFSSVAAVGFALTAYPIGVERGWITRDQARERTLTTLRFLWSAPQGPGTTGVTGYKGFFYHFLDMDTGLRFAQVELSTIDTALLLGGVLACREYFDAGTAGDSTIRALADSLYYRVDWQWAMDGGETMSMGWHPETGLQNHSPNGFILSRWNGYNEANLLYALAIGSPTHAIPASAWTAWTRTYKWDTFHGQTYVQFAPLFGHQYSHLWIDFRGIQDAYMRQRGMDYFENSRRATLAHRTYAIDNPGGWRGYGRDTWGLTASDGPIDSTFVVDGRTRTFHTYWARGAGTDELNDDGTIVPTAAGGSIAFAPEVVIPTLVAMRTRYGEGVWGRYGFLDAFNPTLRTTGPALRHGRIVPGLGWFDTDYLGIDQGPIVGMIENHRTELVWKLMRRNPDVTRGLCRAGFTGGWLAGRCQ
jgi:hypothetical protein